MCDLDWQHIRSNQVQTRKPHCCDSCGDTYPRGTQMTYVVGTHEGTITCGYHCEACGFAQQQPVGSPLHLCSGDRMEAGQWDEAPWVDRYIKAHLARLLLPTPEGFRAYRAALGDADAADEPRDAVPIPLNPAELPCPTEPSRSPQGTSATT